MHANGHAHSHHSNGRAHPSHVHHEGAYGPMREPRKIAEYALVLRSIGVAHRISARDDGWYFVVEEHHLPRVRAALSDYEEENRDWPPRKVSVREPLAQRGSARAPLLWALCLTLFFLVTGPVAGRSPWFDAGTASSTRILHGEVWRAVTALTLHADAGHLLGNAAAGGTFLWAASRRWGEGRAVLATVLAGGLGNLANALAHPHGHQSIGASTAVFGTVGVLVATQLASNRSAGVRRWTDRIGPWVGGLALLGALGASGQNTDLAAHGFGLLAGLVIGVLGAWMIGRGQSSSGRRGWGDLLGWASSAALVGGSWVLAFHHR
jgi:rhomboid protease GluP